MPGFPTDYNALGVQPTDAGGLHAGTPDNVTGLKDQGGGARGGGGSNFTGSYSGTASFTPATTPPPAVPEPASMVLFGLGGMGFAGYLFRSRHAKAR